jgi:transcriptional regulator NrdR family protein
MAEMRCPNCMSFSTHRSRHRGFHEWLLTRLLLRRFMRCDDCERRFLVAKHLAENTKAKLVT